VTPILDRAVAIILLPVFTHYLNSERYGAMMLFYVVGNIIRLVSFMGYPDSLQKLYWDYEGEERKRFLGTAWLYNAVFNLVILIPLIAFSKAVSIYLFHNAQLSFLFILVLISIVMSTQTIVPYVVFRANEQRGYILAYNLTAILSRVGLTALFLVVLKLDILGVFLADIGAGLGGLLICLPALKREIKPTFQRRYFAAVLKLAPYQFIVEVLAWILNLSDRVFIQKLLNSATQVGIYSVGYTFGSAILFLVSPVLAAWRPYIYSVNAQSSREYSQQMGRFFIYFLAICGIALLLVKAFAPDVINLLTPSLYHNTATLVAIVLLGQTCAALSNYFVPTFFLTHKVQLLGISYGVSAALNVALNFYLIPRIGIIGAAWATLIAYGVMAVILFVNSQHLIKINIRIIPILAIAAGVALLWVVLSRVANPNPWRSMALKSAVFLPCLILYGLWFYRNRTQSARRIP
jgi:O-antigen/teichoic acid export membrane protein